MRGQDRHLFVLGKDDTGDAAAGDPFGPLPGPPRKNPEPILRTYVRVAQKEHWCDRCCMMISPGEQYEGRVQVMAARTGPYARKKHVIVWKTHVFPECDFPPDPDDEDQICSWEREDVRQAA